MQSTVALIFGISKYQTSQLTPLPAAQIDAIHFARALIHWGVSETTLFLNEQATLENLNSWLTALSKKEGHHKLVFYFCGHGEREGGLIPNSYLHFFDGRIHLDSLITHICQSRAEESYVFIDACSLRINSLLNPKLEEEINGHKISRKSLFCLLSSGIQESFENNQHGYFTDALLKALAKSRKTEADSSQFFGEISNMLKAENLPLPEMYNIGNHKISFLPSLPLFSNPQGLLPRSEMIGKIEDALILNRAKIGMLVGEKGCGKTTLCQFMTNELCKTYYVNMASLSSPWADLIEIFSSPSRNEAAWGSLFLMDQAENMDPEQLSRLREITADARIQILLISNEFIEEKLSSIFPNRFFQIAMDPLSPEEGEHFMLSYSQTEKEKKLIYLASKGNPLKMQQVAHCINQGAILDNTIEKEEMKKIMSAIYACGCYLDKELFAEVFQLSLLSIALIEQLGLVHWEIEAWVPHPIFYEIAESELISIQKEKVLEYWYRQMGKTPHRTQAAENLLSSVKYLGYENKGDPYLKIAFKALLRDKKDHLDLFIDGAQIFQSLPRMTEASAFLAEILNDLKRPDLALTLPQAKPKKRKTLYLAWLICILSAFLFFYNPFFIHTPLIVNLKQTHPDFVGRDSYLAQLEEICLNWKSTPPIAILWGEAGIGKSEIAIAFANLYAKQFKLLCWIDSETEESYAASYDNLAQLLKIPVDSEKNLVQEVHSYLENEKSIQPWLLIFDNASKQTKLPLKGKGSIVITTRNRTLWHSCSSIEIAPFQEKEAIGLLKKITNNPESIQTHSLANKLDFFPLTLNLAAHYIAETPEMTEELYLSLISKNIIDLLSSMPLDARYPTPLLSSWNIIAAELGEKHPEALFWLHFCSYLYPSGIPSSWVEKWLTDIQNESDPFKVKIISCNILRTLVNQCLMRFDKSTHTLSLHHLKQDVMKKDRNFQKGTVDQVAQFLTSHSENMGKIYEGKINPHPWINLREWETHAAWFLSNYSSECSKEKIADLQNLLGNWKYLRGNYKAAQSYHEQALKNRIELFGEEHAQTTISMNNLAMILWENGQLAESKELFKKALTVLKKISKEDHLDVIITLNNLGWVNWEIGELQEARALLNQSLQLSKKLEACDPDFLQTVSDFLRFLDEEAKMGNKSDIEKATKRALFLKHAGLWVAEVEGNPKKALGYFQKSFELLKAILPEEDPRIAIAYGSTGISLNRAERCEEAEYHLSKALELQKKILGEEHPETAKTYSNLAISLYNLGKYEQALEYHLKGLEIRQKTLGDDHPITAKSYSGTGNTLVSLGRYEEAYFYNQKALDIRIKSLGENHSETAQSYSRLGVNLGKLGRYNEALHHNLKALDILNKIFGENHYLTVKVHVALESIYRDLGHTEKALLHEQKVEELRKLF